jgi:ATP-dependent Clp protease ATP-binding subunit ClpA
VQALARREAELLGQSPASGHVLVALIWEGGGLAAQALADAGLPKSAEEDIRQRLDDAPDSQRGMAAIELQHQAAVIANDLGHDYVGTEHQLLAITRDESLSEGVLSADVRRDASAGAHERMSRAPER